jgi:microcystin-dependent protein
MNNLVLGSSGGGAPHNNMQPYLAMNFFIAVMGYFPVRG